MSAPEAFIAGVSIGVFAGVFVMSLMAIARDPRE